MQKFLKTLLGSVWLGIVIFYYYKNHSYYQSDLPGMIKYWSLWGLPLFTYLGFLFWNWIAEKNQVRLKFNMARILAIFFLSMWFIGNITFGIVKPLMYVGEEGVITQTGETIFNPSQQQIQESAYHFEYGTTFSDSNYSFYNSAPEELFDDLRRASFWDIQLGLTWTYIKVFGSTLVLFFIALVLGRFLHHLIHRKREPDEANTMEAMMIDMILGLGLLSTLFYFVAWLGLFTLPMLLAVLGAVLLIFLKESLDTFKALWNWNFEIKLRVFDLVIPLVGFIVLAAGIQMFDNLSPIPRGWDGLNRYLVIPRDLAAGGSLVGRGSVYAWELLLGFAYLMDVKIALAWTSIPGVMTFVVMAMLARRSGSRVATALALATILVMPMMSFHLSDENKVDVVHWLMGSASILAFFHSLDFKDGKTTIKDGSYLWIAALLAGYAFTAKFTAIILIFTLVTTFAYIEGGWIALLAALSVTFGLLATQGGLGLGTEFLTDAASNKLILMGGVISGAILTGLAVIKKKINGMAFKKMGIFLLLISLPVAPWLTKNAVDLKSINPSEVFYGANDIPEVDLDLNLELCSSTAFFEEYDRYVGYNDSLLLRVLELPWHQTMNDTGAQGAYVDIGFAFLGFLLLALLLVKVNRKNHILVLFGGIYFLIWLLKANGVIWYGFPLFSLMAMLMAATFTEMNKEWWGRLILLIALGSWLVVALDARLSNFAKSSLLLSHTKSVSYDDVRESIFPYSDELYSYLDANDGFVYKIGTPMAYFYPESFERSFDDQLLDAFTCMDRSHGQDFNVVRNTLRDQGFRYVLYDAFTHTVGLDPEGTLQSKVDRFLEFANSQLLVIIFDDKRGHHLFYIPSDEELIELKPPQNNGEDS